jgi:adenylate cyclase class 2
VSRKEREVKLQIGDYERARNALHELGFVHVDKCFDEDYYYSHPCVDYSVSDEALRARWRRCSSSEHYTITYKGPRIAENLGLKTRIELEVELSSVQWSIIKDIFERLGFKNLAKITKTRDLYTAECVGASLDELHGVGYYLELELKCNRGLDLIERVINVLGSSARIEHRTYLEICLETRKCT